MSKNVVQGVVTSDKTAKTRRVEIPRLVRHAKYGKYIRRRTICYVHDENNESSLGDMVEIVESRPRSKMKRWELVRVVAKGHVIDIAALRAADRAGRADQADRDGLTEELTDVLTGNVTGNENV